MKTQNFSNEASQQMESAMVAMAEKARAAGQTLVMPPPFVKTLKMTVIAYHAPHQIIASFPFDPAYANPLGILLGGMIPAYVDAVMGPLTYAAMNGPCVTTEMSTAFLRPVTPETKEFTVDAKVVDKTRRFVVIEAKISSPNGKTLALTRATSIIVNESGSK
jgi:uncharacterized protein (TIGR00369 family)